MEGNAEQREQAAALEPPCTWNRAPSKNADRCLASHVVKGGYQKGHSTPGNSSAMLEEATLCLSRSTTNFLSYVGPLASQDF